MSIASELTTLSNNKANIKAALLAKKPRELPTDKMSQWPASIATISGTRTCQLTINLNPSGGESYDVPSDPTELEEILTGAKIVVYE